jgi:uncharacterized protein (DUF2384 family)
MPDMNIPRTQIGGATQGKIRVRGELLEESHTRHYSALMLTAPLQAVYDPALNGISPERLAAILHVPLAEVARIADVHRNTLARAPGSPKVQARLGEVARILADSTDLLGGDVGKAALWFCHQPLAGFDGQTAEELVTAGHADAVLAHLSMLRDGSYA